VQYRVNKTYDGLGWWLLGAVLQALGFLLLLTFNIHAIWMLSIFANPLIFSGQMLLYIGIMKFLERKASRRAYIALFAGFIVFYYFFIVTNSILGRSLVVSASTAAISLLMAYTLFHEKKKYFSLSADFTASAFLFYGCFQAAMAVVTLTLPPLDSYSNIYRIPIRTLPFVVPAAGSILWTFGFVIMVNQRLNAENLEEKRKLQMVFNMSPDAKAITRLSDGLLVDVNTGFLAMTGYAREEIIGSSALATAIWENADAMRSFAAELGEKGLIENRELAFRRKDGSRFIGLLSGRIIAIQGQDHLVSVIGDITDRKLAEREIRDLLAEKELILKEVHHRIKNNMTAIRSLLSLQAASLTDTSAVTALEDTGNRIQSMMMLYETLYKSSNFMDVSLREYLPPLIDEIISNFPNAGDVRIEKRIDDFSLEVKKVQPLGIIVNELLTNSMKYAFPDGAVGRIGVSASLDEGHVAVIVQDDGRGLPESADPRHSTGFGLMLIEALATQLGGTIRMERGNGTKAVLEFEI